MPEVSIAITARDSYSTAIRKMSAETRSFSKDQDEMEAKLKRLNENQRALQAQMSASKEKLKELHKAFDGMGSAIGDAMIEAEQANFDNIKRNLSLVTKGAKEAEKQMLQTGDAFSKASNRVGVGSGGIAEGVAAIMGSQLASQLGQSLGQAGSVYINSALGSDAGLMANSALNGLISGAASGAALGSIIPGLGTVAGGIVGAGVGALAGGISGAAQVHENENAYFRDYYNGIIDRQAQERAASTQEGSGIAAKRESDLRGLTTLLGGDEAAARAYQSSLIEVGRTPPFSYDTAISLSRDMLGLGLSTDAAQARISSLANASAALNLSEGNVSTIVSALESAQLAGKMETRVAKSLSKMGINVYEALGEEFGLSTDQVAGKLQDLDVERAVSAIYDYMGTRFAGAAEGLTDTYAGAKGILESYQADATAARGVGYNTVREEGIQAEIVSYQGDAGEELKSLNMATGALEAYRENLQEQYKWEARDSLLLGKTSDLFTGAQAEDLKGLVNQFQELKSIRDNSDDKEAVKDASLKMARLEEQAYALAKAAYDSSDWASKELTAEEENTKAVRDLTGRLSEGILLKYQVEQEKTKSLDSVDNGGGITRPAATMPSYVPASSYAASSGLSGSHAAGLQRVPYDNYLALLHEGERVQTAREVREADAGGGSGGARVLNINITIPGGVTVHDDDDIDRIAQTLADGINLAVEAGTY